jgi:hypothetical protein
MSIYGRAAIISLAGASLLLAVSMVGAQQSSPTEDPGSEIPNYVDPTQTQVIAPEMTNVFESSTGACPPGYEGTPITGEPPEIAKNRAPNSPPRLQCTESVESITARLRSAQPPSDVNPRPFSIGEGQWSPDIRVSPASAPILPTGYVAGPPPCPPGFDEIPDGLNRFGIQSPKGDWALPLPIVVCGEKGLK